MALTLACSRRPRAGAADADFRGHIFACGSQKQGQRLSDWLVYFAIPSIIVSFVMIGGGLSISYVAIRSLLALVAPSKPHLASICFGYLWVASVLAIVGSLILAFGYQLNFWEAPGIWGAPGKDSTIWGRLQYIFPLSGFAIGVILNAILEHRMQSRARSVRVGIAVLASLLLVVTLMLSAWHGMQTLG